MSAKKGGGCFGGPESRENTRIRELAHWELVSEKAYTTGEGDSKNAEKGDPLRSLTLGRKDPQRKKQLRGK